MKLFDRPKAVEILGNHLGMFVDRVHVTGSVEVRSLPEDALDATLRDLLKKQARTIDDAGVTYVQAK